MKVIKKAKAYLKERGKSVFLVLNFSIIAEYFRLRLVIEEDKTSVNNGKSTSLLLCKGWKSN